MNGEATAFRSGVIEGFYGRPWTSAQRNQLFRWMRGWGLNTYLFAPKDDLKHRHEWRRLYHGEEAHELRTLIAACSAHGVRFIYGIAPGLNIDYASPSELESLVAKIEQVRSFGGGAFAVLFDDISPSLSPAARSRFGSVAVAQAFVANSLVDFLRFRDLPPEVYFCPTEYCERMSGPIGEARYLREIGERLDPAVQIFWTGPDIISREISVESLKALRQVLRRKPILWENYHANDYDMRRIYLGPYEGRAPEVRSELTGILTNPNCEFEINFTALRTLSLFLAEELRWEPRAAYLSALQEWLPAWHLEGEGDWTLEDLEWIGDAFYQPYSFGARVAEWLRDWEWLVKTPSDQWDGRKERVDRLCREMIDRCDRLMRLRDRSLLYCLYRQVWELRGELVLIRRFLHWQAAGRPTDRFGSDEHLPGLYRGGLVAKLQQLLEMNSSGEFQPVQSFHHRR